MSDDSLVDSALGALQKALQPLADALKTPEDFGLFLNSFGWTLDPAAQASDLSAAFQSVFDRLQTLESATSEELIVLIPGLINDLRGLQRSAAVDLYPFNQPEFWRPASSGPDESFPREVVDLLITSYLENECAGLFGTLQFIGVFDQEPMPGGTLSDPTAAPRQAYLRRSIDWAKLPSFISNPVQLLPSVYAWGGTSFDHRRFIDNLGFLCRFVPVLSSLDDLSPELRPLYFDDGPPLPQPLRQLTILPFADGDAGAATPPLKIALVTMAIPRENDRTGSPVGFAMMPVIMGQAAAKLDFSQAVSLALNGDLLVVPVEVEIRPDGVSLSAMTIQGLAGRTRVDASALLTAMFPADAPWLLLGTSSSSRIELHKAHVGLVIQGAVTALAYSAEAGVDQARVVIDLSGADGFLKQMLGNAPFGFDVPFAVSWSSRNGLRFCNQAKLAANISTHVSLLDVLSIDSLNLGFGPGPDPQTALLAAAVSGSLTLGPISADVENFGMQLVIKTGQNGHGNLGDIEIGFGFKAPDGLGIDVDADGVGGGGFIDFDQNTGRYSGALQLEVFSLDVGAIGLLDTKLPNDTPGYSFLMILTGQFPDIEIGFGFAISGLGGLLAIHRTIDIPALQAGVKSHAVDSVLFPENPVENATKIIKDLSTFFPPADGRYVFGPMADISWGEPHIVEAQIGLFMELPEPVRMALLGYLAVGLPSLELARPLVLIQVNVVGALDLGRKALGVDATLYDSYVITSTLSGDMALRMTWGDEPNFVFSMGGFNPRYQPPPGMPTLNRLQLSLGFDNNPRINASGYFALTSNTVQFGAALQLYASSGDFSVEGLVALDALFQFSPAFSFSADLAAMVALKYDGDVIMSLSLAGSLSGPTPWHVRGSVSVDILFFSASVSFDNTFGTDQAVTVQGQDPRPRLLQALGEPGNWSAGLPDESRTLVAFRKFEASELADRSFILVYPAGSLTVRQKVLPLDHTLALFGSAPPLGGPVKFEIAAARIQIGAGAPEPIAPTAVNDDFAMAQFDVLSDSQKLAAKAFEPAQAGVSLDFDDGLASKAVGMTLEYDTLLVDKEGADPIPAARFGLHGLLLKSQHGSAAVLKSPLRDRGAGKFAVDAPPLVRTQEERFVLTHLEDLSPATEVMGGQSGGMTQSQARRTMEDHYAQNPSARGTLQISSQFEVPA